MSVVGVLLAAGLGTRLRPYSNIIPKPLIPVAGLEPLFFNLFKFQNAGIHRVIINAHHLPEHIKAASLEWKTLLPNMDIRVEVEKPIILGTGGSLINIIRKHADWTQGSSMLVVNADSISSQDFSDFLYKNKKQSSVSVTYDLDHLKKYNPMWITNGFYSGIGKSRAQLGAVAAHKTEAHLLNSFAVACIQNDVYFQNTESDLFNGIYKPLRERHRHPIQAFDWWGVQNNRFWYDLGHKESLLEAQKELFGRLNAFPLWLQALKARHPDIQEIQSGIWSTRPLGDNCKAPLLWVGAQDSSILPDSLGPDLFVFEKNPLKMLGERLHLKDAIILVNAHNQSLNQSVEHDIALLNDDTLKDTAKVP